MLSFVDGAHVGSDAPDGHHRSVIIGSDHDDVRRNGACVLFCWCDASMYRNFLGSGPVMRGKRVELWFGLFFDVWPWVCPRFFDGFWLGVSCDIGIERHLSLIWRS